MAARAPFFRGWIHLTVLVMAVLLGWSTEAYALKPSRHRKIAEHSCKAAGLPRDFCSRVGVEAYNTDAHEWDNMAAHAQPEPGDTPCQGVERTVQRMAMLGAELRSALEELAESGERASAEHAASALGRALHTAQDNCAHQGMPNMQHAWYSLASFCQQADTDPDKDHDAYACARRASDTMMAVAADVIGAAGVAKALGRDSCEPEDPFDDNPQDNPCQDMYLPAPWQACSFLGSAEDWDGVDRRWNVAVVGDGLVASFDATVSGQTAPSPDLCAGDPTAIDGEHEPPIDTRSGPRSCGLAHLLCLGKADDDAERHSDERGAGDHRLGAAADVELLVDGLEVILDGVFA